MAEAARDLLTPLLAYQIENCVECGSDDVVESRDAGELVCRSCGVVQKERIFDIGAEWRTFAEDGDSKSRVAPAVIPFDQYHNNSVAAEGNFRNRFDAQLLNTERKVNRSGNFYEDTDSEISTLCERLLLGNATFNRARELFRLHVGTELSDEGIPSHLQLGGQHARTTHMPKNNRSILSVACVSIAAQTEGVPRSLLEMSRISNVPRPALSNCISKVKRSGCVETNRMVGWKEFLDRYMDVSNVPKPIHAIAHNIAENLRQIHQTQGKPATTISALTLYIIFKDHIYRAESAKQSITRVTKITQVSEATLRSSYRAVQDDLDILLPQSSRAILSKYAEGTHDASTRSHKRKKQE